MIGPSVSGVLVLAARLIETHQAARTAGEAVKADVTKETFDGYHKAEQAWERALADLLAVGLPHVRALLTAEMEEAFGQGMQVTPTHHFALEPGQGVIVPAGKLRLTSFSEHEGAAAFEFEQLGEESSARVAERALRNVRLMANRQLFLAERGRLLRPEAWKDVKRFCAEAGVVDSPLRAEASAKAAP